MRTLVKTAVGHSEMRELPRPPIGPADVLVKTTLTTVCGSDIHFLDDYPMPRGAEFVPMGHEGVGIVVAAGEDVRTISEGDRIASCCVYGCGTCANCQRGNIPLCLTYGKLPGMSNALAGCQGEYFVVPHADLNAAVVPDGISDEEALLAGDVMSTGYAAIERTGLEWGDSVAVFALGPVGLCAIAAARSRGAGLVIGVDSVPERAALGLKLGADVVFGPDEAVEEIRKLTGKRGVDIAIEALGRPQTFQAALDVTRIDGTISSVGVYIGNPKLDLPLNAPFYQRKIITTLCPGGSDRLRRLMLLAKHGPIDLRAMFTHRMPLSATEEAYELFKQRRDGAVKIALVPDAAL
jgi:alcohol dehydrogenase